MTSPWWSLLPLLLGALLYPGFLRILAMQKKSRRRRAGSSLQRLRKRIRREQVPLKKLPRALCAGLPGKAISILDIREDTGRRIAGKTEGLGADLRAAVLEMENTLPGLSREMSRQGILFGRLENIKGTFGNGRPPENLGSEKSGAVVGAYVLKLPYRGWFALGITGDGGNLPEPDQLNDFAGFLAQHYRSESHGEDAVTAPVEFRDEQLHRLQRENRKLRRELETRENSLARIMHDIRLPLSGLMLNHELLEKRLSPEQSPSDEDTRKVLRLMKNQLASLESFTHDILQLETGQWLGGESAGSAATAIEPDRIIARVLEAFEESLRLKKIQVCFHAESGGGSSMPGAALERILYNLISNSIKFCSSPGRLDIASRRRDDFLTIEIEDSGPGLPTSEDTLFELARRNIGRSGRGWGLGLASAMDLAEKLGGRLVVIPPKIGTGANFLLVLPA